MLNLVYMNFIIFSFYSSLNCSLKLHIRSETSGEKKSQMIFVLAVFCSCFVLFHLKEAFCKPFNPSCQ